MENKPCKDCQEKEDYKGVTFISYQSGSPDEPSIQLMNAIAHFVKEMQEYKIRVYTNLQIGTPTGGCGAPPKRPC